MSTEAATAGTGGKVTAAAAAPTGNPLRSALKGLLAAAVLLFIAPVLLLLTSPPAAAEGFGQAVVAQAASHQGAPYQWGATGPSTFDCSGLTQFAYARFGIALPRVAADQFNAIPHIGQGQKEIGDLVFMYDGSGNIYHVGIYAGGNQLWAATHTGDVVRLETIWTSSYLVGRPNLQGSIGVHWMALGGSYGVLGQPQNQEYGVPGGRQIDYQGGSIVWSPVTNAQAVYGSIGQLYNAVGGAGSYLGLPTTDEYAVPGGRANSFLGGGVLWSPLTAAHEVHGSIWLAYLAGGGPAGNLGLPVSDEQAADGGRQSVFQHGRLVWSSATGQVSLQP